MNLEKEVKKETSTKEVIIDSLYGVFFFTATAAIFYFAYKFFQETLERAGPYLDTTPQVPF